MPQPKHRAKVRKVAFANQKGGVGKSTTALFTAAAAAEMGARVLIRDIDPQSNVTISLAPEGVKYTMNDILRPDETTGEVVEGCLGSAICPAGTQWPRGMYLVPAHLSQADRESDQTIGRDYRLKRASMGSVDAFDLVIDDCPPSVGQLTVNSLTDVDAVLLITTAEYWPVQGTHQARRTIRRVVDYYNPSLDFLGVQITSYDPNRTERKSRHDELAAAYPGQLWAPIPDIEVVRKAVGSLSPLSAFGAEAAKARPYYTAIADRLLNG